VLTSPATRPGQRLLIDTSGPYPKSVAGHIYWVKGMDEYTQKCWVYYVKKKSQVPNIVEYHLDYCKGFKYKVKSLGCNNAGEHQSKLQKVCNKRGVMLEYTAPGTPQQNGIVQSRFVTDHDRAFVMMLQCNLKAEFQRILWAEATKEALAIVQIFW
jgi:hypothetical protein